MRIGSSPKSSTVCSTVFPARSCARSPDDTGRRAVPSVLLRASTSPSSPTIWTNLSRRTNDGAVVPGGASWICTGRSPSAITAAASVRANSTSASFTCARTRRASVQFAANAAAARIAATITMCQSESRALKPSRITRPPAR